MVMGRECSGERCVYGGRGGVVNIKDGIGVK